MDFLQQTSGGTNEAYRKAMHQTYEFEEKLLMLLSSFRLDHERSFLNDLPRETSQAIYAYYDGKVKLYEEAHGLRFADVLKVILEKCSGDSTGNAPTFEGTLRENFIELAYSAWSDTRVFSAGDQSELAPLIGIFLHSKPHYEVVRDELPTGKTAFEMLQKIYPDDPDLIIKFNGSCYTIQQLYNGEKTPVDHDVNFYEIMRVVLEHCPYSSSSEVTLRTAIRSYFVDLFHHYKGEIVWKKGERKAIEALLNASEMQTRTIVYDSKQREFSTTPPSKGMGWTPLWVVAGLFLTFLTYRYVAEPAYQWIRSPKVPVQQKV